MVVISDVKKPIRSLTDTNLVIGYEPKVVTATDYYPFGMQMPGRHGFATESGTWHGSYAFSIPPYLFVDHRAGNTPLEYVASQTIELSNGFLTGAGSDNYVAYIADSASMAALDSAYQLVGNGYRYGFNGQEKLDEIYGDGNTYDFGERIQDPRIGGRFFCIDPDTRQYAWQSPYAYHRNSPIVSIDFKGRGDPPYEKNNVHFVPLHDPFVAIFLRQNNESFTNTALKVQPAASVMYSINMQQYESTSLSAQFAYRAAADPGANSNFKAQGYAISDGKVVSGKSSPMTFYFAQSAGANPTWSSGKGDAPKNSAVAFGGGIPIIVNGLAYGETNEYVAGAPTGLPITGDPGNTNQKYLKQRSNQGYALQNDKSIGKSIVAFNSKTNDFLIISQQNGVEGMTMDEIRNDLISKGYDNALSYDGSTSATMVTNNNVIVSPAKNKNSTIPVGATFIDTSGKQTKKKKS